MSLPLQDLVLPAARSRFVLLANHVLAASPAPERLKPHAQRLIQVEVSGWRLPVPPPPPLALRISPAGLLEVPEDGDATAGSSPDLRLTVDMADPVGGLRQLVGGSLPGVQIEGDAALAAEVNWVLANVRWDLASDLERVFGPAVAEGLSRAGGQAAELLRGAVQGLGQVLRRPS